MNENILSLAEALTRVIEEYFSPSDAIYLRKSEYPWDKTSACMIFDLTQLDDIEEDPPTAKQYGMTYALTIEQAYGVIDSANSQLGEVKSDDLVRAFNFYYKHDAVIEF